MVAETIIKNHKTETAANENDEAFKPGRPRSEKARKAILDAARKLLMQSSMNELSIEAIAKKAKVGKTTIYRWWPSKAAVAMEAFLEQPGIQNIVPTTATASEAITRQLESLIRQLRGQNGCIIAGIIAESQSDASVLDLMYDRFLKDRVGNLYNAVERGQQSGEFRKVDLDIAVDMLLGPLFLRILSGEHGIDASFAERYPQQAVRGLQA
ncbi:MAG: TetR/AcrR family transcriptional regulator [Alphaproteobacteria bacterium]|nr:TetR/AcrR family transcriptional regulator [Alphaproteobacteria bacterium]